MISYMKQYEPQELIRTGPHDYKTTTHSSLCISDNGLWHWFSHGVGGRGALNYLIQVKGMDFVSAVRHLCELEHLTPVPFQQSQSGPPPQHERRPFTLPVPDKNAETALQYLKRRGIDSKILLQKCVDMVHEKGYLIGNVDCTVLAQAPQLRPYISSMKEALAPILGVAPEDISIKATTTERLGFTGREEGVAVYASALIYQE